GGDAMALRTAATGGRSPQPAGGNAGAARFFFEVGDRFRVVDDHLVQPLQLGERFLAVGFDGALLHRIVAVDEIGRERIDLVLDRVGEGLVAIELHAERLDLLAPVLLILDVAALAVFGVLAVLRVLAVAVLGVFRVLAVLDWRRRAGRQGAQVFVGVDLRRLRDRLAALLLLLRDVGERLRARGGDTACDQEERGDGQKAKGAPGWT